MATLLDRLVLEYALAEPPVAELRTINDNLRKRKRRGWPTAVAQELQDRGMGFPEIKAHPVLGRHMESVEKLRDGLMLGREPEQLFRELLRRGAGQSAVS